MASSCGRISSIGVGGRLTSREVALMAIWLDVETGEFTSDGKFTSIVFEEE